MTTVLRPLRDEEFDAWRARSQAAYAFDLASNGGLEAERAAAKAEADYTALLPDRLETPGHAVYAVEHEGADAGSLWLAERTSDTGPGLFVYELYVDDGKRGRGIGRAAMLLAEEEARQRGIGSITLNVMGGNERARGLYRSLAYREVAVFMEKKL
jgi:ribosomal protein S18 acetylase RimI-like enzyme